MKNNFKNKTMWQKIVFVLLFPVYIVVLGLVKLYKYLISPLLPHACRFYPTCSEYFVKAVEEYGIFRGMMFGIRRIFRCNPWSKGGFDYVKPNIKGNIKWLL